MNHYQSVNKTGASIVIVMV